MLDNKAILFYATLNYEAQMYFNERGWRLHLLGITINIADADKKKSKPTLQEDINLAGLNKQTVYLTYSHFNKLVIIKLLATYLTTSPSRMHTNLAREDHYAG